ncbi:MAG TPA: hypothetical protein VNO30_14995 [Kofleriaceae bacterium]|nr:hypothetical protein [Kofleriaceae bacterium]
MTSPVLRAFGFLGFSLALSLGLLALCLAPSVAAADDLADAKAVISKQVDALKQGKEDTVRKHFTARLRDRITADAIKAAQKQLASMTLDDLVASVAPGSGKDTGKDSLKIKMKNGRTLTTLVKVDGQWLADTIWFK